MNHLPKKKQVSQPKNCTIRHIAFIMDGNGRWARKRGLPREYGHKVGAEVFRRITEYCGDIGIKYVTVYAFSTENWTRPETEVRTILELLQNYLEEALRDTDKNKIRFIFIGDRTVFDSRTVQLMNAVEEATKQYALTLNLAVNYGGRADIVHAVNTLLQNGLKTVTEEDISDALYTKGIPEPDLIVRTGNEKRLSNFLLWQAAYSELYFSETLWPDYTARDVDLAVADFNSRQRRFGGI